jgi:chromosome segregation ATPase
MKNDNTTMRETAGSSSSPIAAQAQSSQASAELDLLRHEIERLRSGIATSCKQRDLLRASLQQRAVYSLALRNKNAELTREVERLLAKIAELLARNTEEVERLLAKIAELLARNTELVQEAAKWQTQYLTLQHQIEAVLNRFWILRIYRSFPLRFRSFLRDRLMGPGQSQ